MANIDWQIVTGMANGQICVLYSPLTSVNGAKLPLNKGPPRKATIEDMSDAVAAPTILTPHALPMFRDGDGLVRGSKRKREKERMDPRKSKRPELPVTGPGRGGRVGASATQHVVQNLVRDTTRDEDVRRFQFNFRSLFASSATLRFICLGLDCLWCLLHAVYVCPRPVSSGTHAAAQTRQRASRDGVLVSSHPNAKES